MLRPSAFPSHKELGGGYGTFENPSWMSSEFATKKSAKKRSFGEEAAPRYGRRRKGRKAGGFAQPEGEWAASATDRATPAETSVQKKVLRRLKFLRQVSAEVRRPFRNSTICVGLTTSSGMSPTFLDNDRRISEPRSKKTPWVRLISI